MIKLLIGSLFSFVLLFLSCMALAENPSQCTDRSRIDPVVGGTVCNGFYAGIGTGLSFLEPVIINSDESVESKMHLLLPNIYVGYDINQSFAAQLYYSRQGTAKFPSGIGINYSNVGISGLYHVENNLAFDNELMKNTSAYLKVGMGSIINSIASEADDGIPLQVNALTKMQVHFGLGLEYKMANDISIRAEYMSYDQDSSELAITVVKRFARKVAPILPKVVKPTPIKAPEICYAPTGILEGVEFISNSDELTQDAKTVLDGILNQLAPFPKVKLEIRAHTDSENTPEYNMQLSQRRSETVSQYLRSGGINNIDSLYFGETQPIESNDTETGRAKNRRVELEILSNECDF
ncbi:MAG: OmpA family protein [Saccharospirillaceae bacterium]|nr:OmpA family protein [Pseudomonadales bacterium]NRB78300.1 OmpA family protein [Saccharospirillaceae bacterium]